MSAFPVPPRLLNGSIVLLDSDTSAVLPIIALPYNTDPLPRNLQVRAFSGGSQNRWDALLLKGSLHEVIKLDVEIDTAVRHEQANPLALREAGNLAPRWGRSIGKRWKP